MLILSSYKCFSFRYVKHTNWSVSLEILFFKMEKRNVYILSMAGKIAKYLLLLLTEDMAKSKKIH